MNSLSCFLLLIEEKIDTAPIYIVNMKLLVVGQLAYLSKTGNSQLALDYLGFYTL